MSRGNNDEQFKFLISCIRHANNSKVDFAAVAKECGIVSKGAAAKRYERMMKAHGISSSAPTPRTTPVPTPSRRDQSAQAKKRKLEQFAGDFNNNAVDDDENVLGIKDEYAGGDLINLCIKEEDPNGVDAQSAAFPYLGGRQTATYDHLGPEAAPLRYGSEFTPYDFDRLNAPSQHHFHIETDPTIAGRPVARGADEGCLGMSESILISD